MISWVARFLTSEPSSTGHLKLQSSRPSTIEFAKSLVESIYEQSKLLTLLKAIHPSKLTAYQLLFGASHGLIVKPTWAHDDDVTDGCLDINVTLHPRNHDELLPLSTPGLSVLRTLPSKYLDAQGTGPVLELDMVFFSILKCDNPIAPFIRKDELTKVILIQEQPDGRLCVHSEVKDWDQEDDDCTLPTTWICELAGMEEEDALVAGDRGGDRVHKNLAEAALKSDDSNALVVTKDITIEETAKSAPGNTQATSITDKKKTAAKTTENRKQSAAKNAVEEDVAMAGSDQKYPMAMSASNKSKVNPQSTRASVLDMAADLAKKNPKTHVDGKAMAAALSAKAQEASKKTAAATKKKKAVNTAMKTNEVSTKTTTQSADGVAKTSAGKDGTTSKIAEEENGKQRKRRRSDSLAESSQRTSLLDAAKLLAMANPKPRADAEAIAKIMTNRKGEEAKEAFRTENSTTIATVVANSGDSETKGDGGEGDASSKKAKKSEKKGKKKGRSIKESKAAAAAAKETTVPSSPAKSASSEKSPKKKPSRDDQIAGQPAKGLPEGWIEESVPHAKGKGTDKYYYSPEDNLELRSLVEAKQLIEKFDEVWDEAGGDKTKERILAKNEEQKRKPEKVDGGDKETASPKKKAKSNKSNAEADNGEDVVFKQARRNVMPPIDEQATEAKSPGVKDDTGNIVRPFLYDEHEFDPCGSISDNCSEAERSDDSIEEEKVPTPIQVRRARNILRHGEFAKSLNLDRISNRLASKSEMKQKPKRKQNEVTNKTRVDEHESVGAPKKRKGMLFSTTLSDQKKSFCLEAPNAKSSATDARSEMIHELETKYPCRSLQIKLLLMQIEQVVRRTKMAWNDHSSNQEHYSGARLVTYASPAPILVSGSAGVGKSSVVCDTINMFREYTDHISGETKSRSQQCKTNIISYAYVDCASTSAIDIAFVLNSAFKQLHDCYHPKTQFMYKHNANIDEKVAIENDNFSSFEDMNYVDKFPMGETHGSDNEDELDAEDLIESQRNQYRTRGKNGSKGQSLNEANISGKQPSDRSSKYYREARQNSTTTALDVDYEIPQLSRHVSDSSPVASFGRALSILLQGGFSREKRPKYGRCSFLVLDNAERIQSWKKAGSRNALSQLFKLSDVMGVNISVIFISRGSLLTHSGLATGSIADLAHPLNIHFDSYNNVENMKKIFHTQRIRNMITGQDYSSCDTTSCPSFQAIHLQLKDILYKSMMNSFLQVTISYITDISEIMRLSRMLWLKFVAILDEHGGNSDLNSLAWQLMCDLRMNNVQPHHICPNEDCLFCHSKKPSDDADYSKSKGNLLEMLDHNIRETVRDTLANVLMMPGRVIEKQYDKRYAERLPYNSKFLLLAAFLCQQKRPEQDVNLFTTVNTGKRTNRGAKTSDDGTAYASSTTELQQLRVAKLPSFHVERLLGVFTSIMGQYGRTSRQTRVVVDMGTAELFEIISSLLTGGLLRGTSIDDSIDKTDFMTEKVRCTLSEEDAKVIAASVGFPLERYCL